MVKQVKQRVAPNVSGRTNIQRAAPGVHAAPVDRYVEPEVSNASQLAQGLQAISPGFNKFLGARHDAFVQDEQAKGVQQASLSRDEVNEKIASGEMQPEQSPWFQQAYMKQSGINAGKRRARQLVADYNNPEKFNRDTGDINKFIGDTLNADIDGLDDTDYKVGYLASVRQAEEKLRNDFTAEKIENVRKDVRDQAHQAYYDAFEAMGEDGEFTLDSLREVAESAREMNLENSELNALAFSAAETYSITGEGHPEVFELFKNKGENGVASLYFTEEFKSKVEAGQQTAQKIRDRALSAQAGDDKVRTYFGFQDRVQGGESVPREEMFQAGLTIGEINKLEKMGVDQRADGRIGAIMDYTLTSKDNSDLFLLKKSEQEDYVQGLFTNILNETKDPAQTAMMMLDKVAHTGIAIPQISNMLLRADPANPEGFKAAASLYHTMANQHPKYTRMTFTDTKQAALFDQFNDMTSNFQYGEEEAMQKLADTQQKDIDRATFLQRNPKRFREFMDKIDDEFGEGPGAGLAKDMANDYLFYRLMDGDGYGMSPDLMDKAVEHVASRFTKIGDSMYPVSTEGINTPFLQEALDDEGDYLEIYWKEKHPNALLTPTRLIPDVKPGSWRAVNGGTLMGRVELEEFTHGYRIHSGSLEAKEVTQYKDFRDRIDSARDRVTELEEAQHGLRNFVGEKDPRFIRNQTRLEEEFAYIKEQEALQDKIELPHKKSSNYLNERYNTLYK